MTRRKPRFCACGANITALHGNVKRCAPCQYLHDRELERANYLRRKANDLAYLRKKAEGNRTYKRRKKAAGEKPYLPRFQQCPHCYRLCRTCAQHCSVCGTTLAAAKIVVGRRNQQAHGVPVMREGR